MKTEFLFCQARNSLIFVLGDRFRYLFSPYFVLSKSAFFPLECNQYIFFLNEFLTDLFDVKRDTVSLLSGQKFINFCPGEKFRYLFSP